MDSRRKTIEDLARLFRAVSVESRVRMLGQLRGGPLCVGALSARLGITQGAVSQHLRVLREAGLVRPRKRGYFTHYQVDEGSIKGMARTIKTFLSTKRRKGGRGPCAAARPSARNRRI